MPVLGDGDTARKKRALSYVAGYIPDIKERRKPINY